MSSKVIHAPTKTKLKFCLLLWLFSYWWVCHKSCVWPISTPNTSRSGVEGTMCIPFTSAVWVTWLSCPMLCHVTLWFISKCSIRFSMTDAVVLEINFVGQTTTKVSHLWATSFRSYANFCPAKFDGKKLNNGKE